MKMKRRRGVRMRIGINDTVVVRGSMRTEKTCVTVGTEPLKEGELQVRSIFHGDREGGDLRK